KLGGAEPINGIRPGLLPNFHQLVADVADRLVPGDALPLSIDEFHWVLEPAVTVHELTNAGALGAVRTAIDRAVPGRLLARPDAVLDFTDHRAADRAVRTDV